MLGTTINAAFIHEFFPDYVLGFADENVSRINSKFRGMPVCHPSELGPSCRIFVGPQWANELRNRMISTYEAEII